MAYKIFISYRRNSSINAEFVRNCIIDNSEYSASDIFLDKHGIGPEYFDKKIKTAIMETNCVLLLVTKNCFIPKEDDWYLKEIKNALESNKKIIPILFDDIQDIKSVINASQVEDYLNKDDVEKLSKNQGIHYSDEYPSAFIKKVISFINEANRNKTSLDHIKMWSKIIMSIILIFSLFFSLCFGIGYLWGNFTSSSEEENVLVDNTTIVDNSLLFEYAELKAVYNLDKNQIILDDRKEVRTKPELSRSELVLSTLTFSGIRSLTERNLTSIKYLRFLKNGSKASKIALVCIGAGICLGSVCGFSQGSYVGRIVNQRETANIIYPKLEDKKYWLPVISRYPLLERKYNKKTTRYYKNALIIKSSDVAIRQTE